MASQPVQKASLARSLQVQTNLGSTNKSFVHPSAQWKLGSVAMPWMDVRLFGCSAPSFVCGVPPLFSLLLRLSMCASFYGQYPTALIGAAKRFQADLKPMQCNRRINAPLPSWSEQCNLLSYLFILCVRSQVCSEISAGAAPNSNPCWDRGRQSRMLLGGCGHGRVDQTAPPVYFRGNSHYAVSGKRKMCAGHSTVSHLLPHERSDI